MDPLSPSSARQQPWLQILLSKTGALLILAAVAGASGVLISPGLPEQTLPYGDESLGHVATQSIRITRDYDVPDPEATDRRRTAAVAEVRPVYDFDGQLLPEVESRVAESFGFARMQLAAHPLATSRPTSKARREVEAGQTDTLREELVGRLQTFIEPRDFAALVEEGFSQRAEAALANLVRPPLVQFTVEDRALLPPDRSGDGQRGILVRSIPEAQGPQPVGEVVNDLEALRDLSGARGEVERAAEDLPADFSPALRRALGRLARGALRPNLTYDAAETARRRERARDEVTPVVLHFSRGEKILEAGERIEPRHLLLFKAIRAQARPMEAARARVGAALLAALMGFLCYKLVRPSLGFRPSRRDALFLGVLLLFNLALAKGLLVLVDLLRSGAFALPALPLRMGARLSAFEIAEALPFAAPVAAGTLLVRVLIGPELTALYALASAVLFGLLGGGSLGFAVFALAGSLVAARRARDVVRWRNLFQVGLFIASTNIAVVFCLQLLAGHLIENELLAEIAAGAVGGAVLTPLIVGAVQPLLELVFGYLSDARLADLCNLNQPALKELIIRAPGTYHHSIVLAGLAEGAARVIGANPWMARAIGLYHDLGKGKAPLVFGENQKGGSRSEGLPSAALLETLRRHPMDGVELGRRYKLPRPLLEAIAQHHGTRRVGHSTGELFTREASDARSYEGPKPRRAETALVMLADAVETQSRKLSTRDLSRLREMVRLTLAEIAEEGQLDDCGLLLGDLPKIAESFTLALSQQFEARVPEPGAAFERPSSTSRSLDLN